MLEESSACDFWPLSYSQGLALLQQWTLLKLQDTGVPGYNLICYLLILFYFNLAYHCHCPRLNFVEHPTSSLFNQGFPWIPDDCCGPRDITGCRCAIYHTQYPSFLMDKHKKSCLTVNYYTERCYSFHSTLFIMMIDMRCGNQYTFKILISNTHGLWTLQSSCKGC